MSPLLVSGLVGAVAPPGPPNGGGYGGHYLLETPEGGPGRSRGPYAITVPIVKTLWTSYHGWLTYQVTTKPPNCPPMDSVGGSLGHAVCP